LREKIEKNDEAGFSAETEAEQATQKWLAEGLSEGHPVKWI